MYAVLRKRRDLFSSLYYRYFDGAPFPRLVFFFFLKLCVCHRTTIRVLTCEFCCTVYIFVCRFVSLALHSSSHKISILLLYFFNFSTYRLCYWLSKQRKMGLSEDAGHENAEERFRSLCADLNIDKNTADEAWRNYETISTNYSLEVTKFVYILVSYISLLSM